MQFLGTLCPVGRLDLVYDYLEMRTTRRRALSLPHLISVQVQRTRTSLSSTFSAFTFQKCLRPSIPDRSLHERNWFIGNRRHRLRGTVLRRMLRQDPCWRCPWIVGKASHFFQRRSQGSRRDRRGSSEGSNSER